MLDEALRRLIIRELEEIDALLGKSSPLLETPVNTEPSFEQALIHPGVKFEIVFGVSGSNWPLYDLEHGKRAIGYESQDYSEVPEEEWGR